MKFRDYQEEIIDQSMNILSMGTFVYLAMEVRTGKTLTSLGICQRLNPRRVLFLTKKKAISSVQRDYEALSPDYLIEVINYESAHKREFDWFDIIILDEAHGLGAFPKPSGRAKLVKDLVAKASKVILLSGTPTPESYSQVYHQVFGIKGNPFRLYKNFYQFAKDYVKVSSKIINGFSVNDYSDGKNEIINKMKPYMINYTQKEAGFVVNTTEIVLSCKMSEETHMIVKNLKKDFVLDFGKGNVVLGDTSVKLMTKIHQIASGSVKTEDGAYLITDFSKANFIFDFFKGTKIGIFYKFKSELDLLKSVYKDGLTTELDEFNSTDKSIALQIVSGREGISLRNAEALVYFNIDFSATSYWQSRDRMTTIDRLNSHVYWVFSDVGIEKRIYDAVSKKKDYTLSHFKKDFL
jgi:hypothetical protein